MKFYLTFIILLLVAYSKSDTNCESIKPSKASDCVLSAEDKKKYKYCCMEESIGTKYCDAYTKDEYDLQKEVYKEADKAFGTKSVFECNNSSYLKFGIIFFIMLLF